jgi:two-component system, NarL family, nitrate/nitrite response regulator NarL
LAIVEIDLQNGNLEEIAAIIRLLRSLMPDGKVVLVVDTDGRIDLQRALAFSPDACIFNLGSREILIRILELTFMDQRVVVLGDSTATAATDSSTEIASNNHDLPHLAGGSLSLNSYPPGTNGHTSLSPRERQILIYLAEGKSNKAIARQYNLSEATVKVHLKAILRKTRTQNRTQAAIWAIKRGFPDHFSELSSGMLDDSPPVGQPTTIQSAASHHRI